MHVESNISKITGERQFTIPKEICEELGIEKGDALRCEIENGRMVARKTTPVDEDWYKFVMSTLTEWNDPADDDLLPDNKTL